MDIRAELTYTKKRQIGVGQGMNSEVFLAFDVQLAGEIAVKEIPKALGVSVQDYFREAQRMFAAEHPNVVRVNYACETASTVGLAMRYYRNGSLQDRIAISPLPLMEVIEIGQGILNGLGCIHRLNLVHFDVKPSNILFDDNGAPLLADFGQTRMIGPGGWAHRPGMYRDGIPPECYSGAGLFQSDIYQVGLTLYRAVNGDVLFNRQRPTSDHDAQQMTLAGSFPDRAVFLPHVPTSLRQVICNALHVDPGSRFPSCRDFADALGKVRIEVDWKVIADSNGGMHWTAKRDGRADTMIDLLPNKNRWNVQIHTGRGHDRRRKDTEKWRKDLTHKQARSHLRQVFRSLGQPR